MDSSTPPSLARELSVERDWVYDHANAIGGVRLGGPRGRLRFDLAVVRERLGGGEPFGLARRPPTDATPEEEGRGGR